MYVPAGQDTQTKEELPPAERDCRQEVFADTHVTRNNRNFQLYSGEIDGYEWP